MALDKNFHGKIQGFENWLAKARQQIFDCCIDCNLGGTQSKLHFDDVRAFLAAATRCVYCTANFCPVFTI